jgi:hypothetical protein
VRIDCDGIIFTGLIDTGAARSMISTASYGRLVREGYAGGALCEGVKLRSLSGHVLVPRGVGKVRY